MPQHDESACRVISWKNLGHHCSVDVGLAEALTRHERTSVCQIGLVGLLVIFYSPHLHDTKSAVMIFPILRQEAQTISFLFGPSQRGVFVGLPEVGPSSSSSARRQPAGTARISQLASPGVHESFLDSYGLYRYGIYRYGLYSYGSRLRPQPPVH